jgi:hypothetical protein
MQDRIEGNSRPAEIEMSSLGVDIHARRQTWVGETEAAEA